MPGSPFTKGSTTLAGFNQGEGNIGYAPAPRSLAKAGLNFAQGDGMKRENWRKEKAYAADLIEYNKYLVSQGLPPLKYSGVTQRTVAASKPRTKKPASADARRTRRTRRSRSTRRSRN